MEEFEMESFLNSISHDRFLFEIDDYVPSAWIGHAPFLKFLIREQKPNIFVELGVHNGFSFFTACQSVKELNLQTKTFAIDNWLGDSQAGFFDDSVFELVKKINLKYREFSSLLKLDFDEALETFQNQSIELLHIDGFHSYESVKHDFESWLPKMQKNGIILLHDIHVRRDSFGVYKFWQEIKPGYKSLEFVGSHGLGVIFLGEVPGENLNKIYQMTKSGKVLDVLGTFGSISDDVIQNYRVRAIEQKSQKKFTNIKKLKYKIWKGFQ